jgi:protein-tyrosine phosphatase
MAEVLLQRLLADEDVRVSSAGLHPGGRPATDHGIATMAARGLDLSGHRSRQLDQRLLEQADLVVGMAREHVREVGVLDPAGLDRAFTLKELVRLASAHGPRPAGEPFDAWLARVVVSRRRDALVGVGHDEAYDIEDPVGRSRADYDATAAVLERLLTLLVALGWPPAGHRSATADEQERSA